MLFPDEMITISGDRCIFCSFPKEHAHHFPPRSLVSGGFLFPTCSACNTSIRDKSPFSLLGQLKIARDNLRKFRSQFERYTWEWNELTNEIVWDAENHFQKLELGTSTVQPPAAKQILEESKQLNFELCGSWFGPATRARKLKPLSIEDSKYFDVAENVLFWIEAKHRLQRRPVTEGQVCDKLLTLLKARQIETFLERFKDNAAVRTVYMEGTFYYFVSRD